MTTRTARMNTIEATKNINVVGKVVRRGDVRVGVIVGSRNVIRKPDGSYAIEGYDVWIDGTAHPCAANKPLAYARIAELMRDLKSGAYAIAVKD